MSEYENDPYNIRAVNAIGGDTTAYDPYTIIPSEKRKKQGKVDDISIIQGLKNDILNTKGEAAKIGYDIWTSTAETFIKPVLGEEAALFFLGGGVKGQTGWVDPENGRVIKFDKAAYDRDGYDAVENKRYYELAKINSRGGKIQQVNAETGEDVGVAYAKMLQQKFDEGKEIEESKRQTVDVGSEGFLKALKSGELDDALVTGLGFIKQTAMHAVAARLTMGTSMAATMIGSSWVSYNEQKAKAIYGDDPDSFSKLVKNDQDESAIPAALGAVGYVMERAGYKGMMKELVKKSFTGKKVISLLLTANREGVTEYGQGLTERLNENLGKQMSLEESVKDVGSYMWTEQAWDNYFAGLVGSTGMTGGGAIVQGALRSDPTSNQFINKKINNIAALTESMAKAGSKKELKDIQDLIQIEETEFKDYLESNKKLSGYLNESEITSLTDFVNKRRDTSAEIINLKKGLKKGAVSQSSFDAQTKVLFETLNNVDIQIKNIKVDANMRLLKADLDSGDLFVGDVKGLEQVRYETNEEFIKALEKEYKLKGIKMPKMENINVNGTKIGNKLLINMEVAAEQNAVATSTHEVLHGIVKSTLQADDASGNLSVKGENMVKMFMSQIGSSTLAKIEKVLKDGGYKKNEDKTDKEFKEYGEEYLTIYAQLSKEGNLNKNSLQKAASWFTNLWNNESDFKEIGFETGEQIQNFLDAYVQDTKKGKFRQEFKDLAAQGVKMPGDIKYSRSTVDLEKGDGDLSQKIDRLTKGATTIEEFQKPGGEFDNVYTGILDGKFDRVFGEGITQAQKEIQRQNLADRLINFDPAKTPELSKWLYGGSGKAGNVVYAGLVAKKKLFEAGEKRKREVKIDSEEVKELEDTSTPTTEIEDRTKPRNLKDFDVEIEDGLVDATIEAEVEALLEKNPDDIELQMENLILKDIRKNLDNVIGKIAKNKKTGKRGPTAEYEAFIRNEYDLIVSSLGIETIRTAYKPWFERKKIRTEKYKGISSKTGKVTNYVKDVFENKTNKREYIRWFLESNERNLTERRTALIRRIARRKAKIATDSYIETNSKDLGKVAEAKLRILSRAIEDVQVERKSFDSVKFSKGFEQEFNMLFRKLEQRKKGGNWYFKKEFEKEAIERGLVDSKGKIKSFPNKGIIYEQAFADYFVKMAKRLKIKGFKVESFMASEKGGMADFIMSFSDAIENHEIKASMTAFMGSVSISNFINGKIDFATDIHNEMLDDPLFNMDKFKESYMKSIDFANKRIRELNLTRDKNNQYDEIDQNVTSGEPQYFPKEVYNDKDFPIKVFYAMPGDASVITRHYKGKGVNSISFVNTKNGEMSFRLNDESLLNLDMLDAKTVTNFTFRNGGTKIVNGEEMIAVSLGVQFKITELNNNPKTAVDITDDVGFRQAASGQVTVISKPPKATQALNNAIKASRTIKDPKGITVLDFDDTLATSKSLIRYTQPDGTKGTLTPEQYASTYQDLQDLGYNFDFSEFNKVVDGKVAPLFQKALKLQSKFGPKSMFVLTARPAESAPAIFAFIKANGLNIPLENITGLANSTSEAKAVWVAEKVGEGYNDFYFADDALQNVQAVKNMLDQFDVKSKVQQAKIKFSKTMNDNFNDILENVTGIESQKRFDFIKARKRGASKGKFRLFIPPSHEDFVGLLYNFIGKGREGDAHRDFLEQALVRPLNRANKEYDTARQSVATDYKLLNKAYSNVKDIFNKKTPDGDFTYQDAIRIYLWDKHGYNIPGLSPIDQKNLVELVESNSELQSYANALNIISKQEKYIDPTDGWDSGDIRMDLDDATGRIGRAQFFEEFSENADIIFSKENLNKIEAGYGKGVREALEDILYRIKTGRNKPTGQSGMVNSLMNWVNGSVGSVMFFNIRSSLLQQMSIVNYINFADNNIFAVAKAFANQKQYWADWSFIFNSDMLKQRRGGIMTDVNGAELAAEMRKSKNPHRFLISKLLEIGFLPTQIGDNIAIATGGATYYRNRINTYLRQGLSQKEAEAKAFTDFQDITQSTQQSARPDMVSQQQASLIGKIILNFQNVTSQFNRLGKKAFQDIYNRRITKPNTTQMQSDISNASRITYYFAVQNLIFYTLQTALFAMMFDDDEEDNNNLFLKKRERLINGSIDSVLRGTGLYGSVFATLKNVAIAFARQRDVNYNPDESAVVVEALNLSPVLGIKARKIVNAEKTLNYNKKVIKEMETFDIDNPQWSAVTNYVEGFTNAPLNRLYNKTQNVRQGLSNEHAAWERSLLFLGWSQYNLNLENEKMDKIKAKTKSKKSKSKKARKSTIPLSL